MRFKIHLKHGLDVILREASLQQTTTATTTTKTVIECFALPTLRSMLNNNSSWPELYIYIYTYTLDTQY